MIAGAKGDPAEVAVRIKNARKDYGKAAGGRREAVADVSITVGRGSIHGLLGPNGAGKTTTLKMLLGLVRPSGGTFELLGVPAHQPGARARVGFLPEQPYFPAQLTAGEAMMLYGRLAGLSRSETSAETDLLLDRVGLEGRQKTPLSKFSRGMLQRLGLAAALLGKPEVLVLDEPTSGLDPVGQRDIRNLMLDLKAEGATILLSSHQLSEVEVVSDEVTILNRGRVAAEGRIESLLNVAGQVSVTAKGEGPLPTGIAAFVTDTARIGATAVFSAAEKDVRAVVDALDDAGWRLISLEPKRSSLEDYFAMLLEEGAETPAAPAAVTSAAETPATETGGAR
ncbi:MAG: ABC transporter ATP-binding protein [Coriobacteriia bacterium]